MDFHEKVVRWAQHEHENHVHEIPMGSNRGTRVEYYQSFDFIAGGGYPWCVDFFLAAWASSGHALPYKTGGAYDMLNWAIRNKWKMPLNNIIPGDACIWNIGAGHLSMYLEHTKTMVRTIDGNWADSVQIVEHPTGELRGCMHVPEVHSLPVPKIPLYVVVGSANGHKIIILTQRSYPAISKLLPAILKKRGWAGITIKRVK